MCAVPIPCAKVARGLLLYGQNIEAGTLSRDRFMRRIGVPANTFRAAGDRLGAKKADPGLRFFDSSKGEWIAFGPGAGLVLGISIGTASLRAALVDANGAIHHPTEIETLGEQLAMHPDAFMVRLADSARPVLERALNNPRLLVDGELPLLGVSVAWPTPLDSDKKPVGPALAHDVWRSGRTLTDRVAVALSMPRERVHVFNDAHAAAMAIAFDRTRLQAGREHPQRHPELEIVVRLSATLGAATIIIEPPTTDDDPDHGAYGPTSGFARSTLIAGRDGHAGELGHVPVSPTTVAARRDDGIPGLGPLVPVRCSCTRSGDDVPDHLEAYLATEALAERLAPGKPIGVTIHRLRSKPDDERHRRVLEDIGVLLGDALVQSVAMLNPSGITLTGALAVPTVQRSARTQLASRQVFGTPPDMVLLPDTENKYVRARGAALMVLREAVHGRLISLLGGNKRAAEEKVHAQLLRLKTSPF